MADATRRCMLMLNASSARPKGIPRSTAIGVLPGRSRLASTDSPHFSTVGILTVLFRRGSRLRAREHDHHIGYQRHARPAGVSHQF